MFFRNVIPLIIIGFILFISFSGEIQKNLNTTKIDQKRKSSTNHDATEILKHVMTIHEQNIHTTKTHQEAFNKTKKIIFSEFNIIKAFSSACTLEGICYAIYCNEEISFNPAYFLLFVQNINTKIRTYPSYKKSPSKLLLADYKLFKLQDYNYQFKDFDSNEILRSGLCIESPIEDFNFEEKETHINIKGYKGKSNYIVIPSYINNKPVRSISSLNIPYKANVYIPETVIRLNSYSIQLDSYNTIYIDDENPVFEIKSNCIITKKSKHLVKVGKTNTIPKDIDIKSIGPYALYLNHKIKNIVIPSSVRTISYEAFAGSEVQNVIISEGVENIEDYAFETSSLKNVTLPKSIKHIGKQPFGFGFNTIINIPKELDIQSWDNNWNFRKNIIINRI